jgi:small conductance mechanosensitive channel
VTSQLDVSELATNAVAFLPRVLVALLILLGFWIGYRFTRVPFRRLLSRSALDQTLISLLVDHVYRFVVLVFGIVMAASQLGINVGAALAGIGIAGVAMGLAAQDTLANTIAGFVIFWDKPFAIGDYITVRGKYGCVHGITLRSTRIRTQDNMIVVIPNKHVVDEVVVNHSQNGPIRLNIAVAIAYEEAVDEARAALLRAVETVPGVLRDPRPGVVVESFAESGVSLLVRIWIAGGDEETRVTFAAREACKAALDAAGIEIPYPHRHIVVRSGDASVTRVTSGPHT